MAAPRRKKGIAKTATPVRGLRERLKVKQATPHPHGNVDYERDYQVRSILDEDQTRYLIDWENDEVTGEQYEATWEPKENANVAAVLDWQRRRDLKNKSKQDRTKFTLKLKNPHPRKSAPTEQRRASETPPPTSPVHETQPRGPEAAPSSAVIPSSPVRKPRGRPRRTIIDSSPATGDSQQLIDELAFSQSEKAAHPTEIEESQESYQTDSQDRLLFIPDELREPQQIAAVQLSDPPSSYLAGAYEKVALAAKSLQDIVGDLSQVALTSLTPNTQTAERTPARNSPIPQSQGRTEIPVITAPTTSAGENSSSRAQKTPPQGSDIPTVYTDHLPDSEDVELLSHRDSLTPASKQTSVARSIRLANPVVQAHQERYRSVSVPSPTDRPSFQALSQLPKPSTPVSYTASPDRTTKQTAGSNYSRVTPSPSRDTNPLAKHPSSPQVPTAATQQSSTCEDRTAVQLPYSQSLSLEHNLAAGERSKSPTASHLASNSQVHGQFATKGAEATALSPTKQVASEFPGIGISTPAFGITKAQHQGRSSAALTPIPSRIAPSVSAPPDQENQSPTRLGPFETPSALLTQVPVTEEFRGFGALSQRRESPAARNTGAYELPSRLSSLASAAVVSNNEPAAKSRAATPSTGSSFLQSIRAIRAKHSPKPLRLSEPRTLSAEQDTMDSSSQAPPSSYADRLRAIRSRATRKVESEIPEPQASQPVSTADLKRASQQPASAIPPCLSIEIAGTLASNSGRSVSPASQQALRSPSSVPAVVPEEVVTKEDQNTSERYPTLLPQILNSEPVPRRHIGSLAGTGPTSDMQDPESANTFIVPIRLIGHQRDQYSQEVIHHQNVVANFRDATTISPQVLGQGQQFVDRLYRTVLHPDLNNPETATQHDDEPERQAKWDVACSAKFRFLHSLLNKLREKNMEIAIAAHGRNVCDILRVFLTGIQIPFVRPGRHSPEYATPHTIGTALIVTIIDLDLDLAEQPAPADLVIAMESSIDVRDASIRSLRLRKGNEWSPLLTLVVPYSIEHVDRCLLATMSTQARLRALILAIGRFEPSIAKSDDTFVSPDIAALAVANYITARTDWPLVTLGILEDLDSQTQSEQESAAADAGSLQHRESPGIESRKRPLDVEVAASSPATKRVRPDEILGSATPFMLGTINPQDLEATHVSDSLEQGSQENTVSTSGGGLEPSTSIERLWIRLHEGQARIDALESSLENVQFRYEEQRKDLVSRTKERDEATVTAQTALERMEKLDALNKLLRTEKSEIKAHVNDLMLRLETHTVPERGELETSRAELERAKAETTKADKRVQAAETTLQYTRDLYQKASNVTMELTQEKTAMEVQLREAQRLASNQQTQARGLTNDAREKLLKKENQQLKAQLADREHMIREMAKREISSRGRIGTRGSSAVRHSRQSSPAAAASNQATAGAARVQHPLRKEN